MNGFQTKAIALGVVVIGGLVGINAAIGSRRSPVVRDAAVESCPVIVGTAYTVTTPDGGDRFAKMSNGADVVLSPGLQAFAAYDTTTADDSVRVYLNGQNGLMVEMDKNFLAGFPMAEFGCKPNGG
jgi:hypothetical protein